MSMGSIVLRLAAFAAAICLLTGCWDMRDINDLSPILSLGFDYTSHGWQVTAEDHLVSPGGGQSYKSVAHYGQGATLAAAISDLRLELARRLYVGTARIYVLGRGVLHGHTQEVVRFLAETHEADETAFLVASTTTAQSLLEAPDGALGSTTVRLLKEFETWRESRDGHVMTRIWEAQRDMSLPGAASFIALPIFEPHTAGATAIGTVLIGPTGQQTLDLSRQTGVALQWLMNRPSRNIIPLSQGAIVTTESVRSQTSIVDSRHVHVSMRLVAEGYYLPDSAVMDQSRRDVLAQETAQAVLVQVQQLVSRVQQAGVDPFGWAEAARRRNIAGFDLRHAVVSLHISVSVRPRLSPTW